MNQNSHIILTLCSHMCMGEGIRPLEPKEWSEFAKLLMEHHLQPSDLLQLSIQDLRERLGLSCEFVQRLIQLLGRSPSLSFELSQYENMGICALTRADEQYPRRLKTILQNHCPPIFYYAGNLALLDRPGVGYVGSRTVTEADMEFTKATVQKTLRRGCQVISGGAKGVDTIAQNEAIACGSSAISFLSDSMLRRMSSGAVIRSVQDGQLLLLSVVKPDAGFNPGIAMMRNRYIYAQSVASVVIRSDYQKGGTWSGAVDNLKHGWCPLYCRENPNYQGNTALIDQGAVAIDEAWDGDVTAHRATQKTEQMSLFAEE